MDRDVVIRAEGIGKRYQLGQAVDLSRNFREALAAFPRKLARIAKSKARRALEAARAASQTAEVAAVHDPETPPGSFWALRNVDFEVKRGEVVGIIGRNGAGKSTLLKVLSRITTPTAGHAEIRGRLASLLEVGTGFHPELTGRENIYLNGAILGMHKAEIARKFDEIVAFAEVEKFLDTPVKRYSSGMYVRLAFAVAAHLEPEILVIDEVLAVGDAAFQKKCLGRMNDVAKGGRTVLFVSHNMAAIQQLTHRCIYLINGTPASIGPTGAVLHEYLNQAAKGRGSSVVYEPKEGKSAWISKVEIVAPGFNDVDLQIPMNAQFSIRVEVQCTHPLKRPVILIQIATIQGTIVFAGYSHESLFKGLPSINSSATIECGFVHNYLMPGQYVINVFLGRIGERIDAKNECLGFQVVPVDVYGTGQMPNTEICGLVWMPQRWEITA